MILRPCANIFAQKTFDVKVRWAVGGFKVASCTCQLTTLLPQKKETFWAHLDPTTIWTLAKFSRDIFSCVCKPLNLVLKLVCFTITITLTLGVDYFCYITGKYWHQLFD